MGTWAWEISARFYRRTYGPLAHRLDEAVFARVGDVRGKVVADVGCGPGVVTRKLLERGAARVYALDVSPAMLAQAPDDPCVEKILGNVEDDPLGRLGEGAIDLAIFKRSLYMPRPAALAALRSARRALRPRGAIVVVHPEASVFAYAFGRPPRLRRHTPYHLFNRGISTLGVLLGGEDYGVYTRDGLARLLADAGDGARVEVSDGGEGAFNLGILWGPAA